MCITREKTKEDFQICCAPLNTHACLFFLAVQYNKTHQWANEKNTVHLCHLLYTQNRKPNNSSIKPKQEEKENQVSYSLV
jgi:hypothetical protein